MFFTGPALRGMLQYPIQSKIHEERIRVPVGLCGFWRQHIPQLGIVFQPRDHMAQEAHRHSVGYRTAEALWQFQVQYKQPCHLDHMIEQDLIRKAVVLKKEATWSLLPASLGEKCRS